MFVKVLGTAAGGGFPQWNCNCSCCTTSRKEPERAPSRLHACIAISAKGNSWYLVNATPDIQQQMETLHPFNENKTVRSSPANGILLTDAEFDHTIGLLIVREGSRLDIIATRPVIECLKEHFPVGKMLKSYANFNWQEIECDLDFSIDQGQISVRAFPVAKKPPKYTNGCAPEHDHWVIGYKFTDTSNNRSILFAPQVGKIDQLFIEQACEADILFIDGTCSTDKEIPALGFSSKTSLDMGHLPLFEDKGIVEGVNNINRERVTRKKPPLQTYLIHINNTNPVLVNDSKEHKSLQESNILIATDGDEIEV